MIVRFIAPAFALAAFAVLASPAPAQARMNAPGLNEAVPGVTEQVHYRRYRHSHRRHHARRHRHCWTKRIRVRAHHGRFVVKTVRRCGWR